MPVFVYAGMISAAVLAAWYTITLKQPAARANLMAGLDLPEAPTRPSGIREVGRKLRRIVPQGIVKNMEAELTRAGHPHGIDLPKLLGIQAALMAVLAVGGFVLLGSPLFALFGAGAGFFLPRYWISKQRIRRQDDIKDAVSDTLDQLTICVESGLGFDAALVRVASTNEGPLSAELDHTVSDMRAGVPRDQALRALAERTQIPDIKTLTQALIQAQRHGTPLANTLRVQAAEIRDRRKQRIEEHAAKLGTKLIFPMALCFFPVIFVALLGPAVAAFMHVFR
jgi:tight adherence protein C